MQQISLPGILVMEHDPLTDVKECVKIMFCGDAGVAEKGWNVETNNLQIENGNCVNYFYGAFSVAVLSTCNTGPSPC